MAFQTKTLTVDQAGVPYGVRSLQTATIANGAALSGTIDLSAGGTLVGIVMDATAWTAAAITFSVSADNSTFNPLYNTSGVEVTIPSPAAQTYIALDPADFTGIPYLKIRSGTNGTPVNQGAARSLGIVVRSI